MILQKNSNIYSDSNIKFLVSNAFSNEQFNFDITEIEITDKGNKYKGIKRVFITTDDGLVMVVHEFEVE